MKLLPAYRQELLQCIYGSLVAAITSELKEVIPEYVFSQDHVGTLTMIILRNGSVTYLGEEEEVRESGTLRFETLFKRRSRYIRLEPPKKIGYEDHMNIKFFLLKHRRSILDYCAREKAYLRKLSQRSPKDT